MKRPRLLLADEQTLMLEGLHKLLESEFDIAGVAGDGRSLVSLASTTKPDAIVTEIALPLLNGIEAVAQLAKKFPKLRAIFLTTYADREHVTDALRVGAMGYLLKRCSSPELFSALREVLRGRAYITPLITNELLSTFREALSATTGAGLTSRQREILQLIAEGHSLKEISNIINVSQKTVEYHKYGMMEKLGIRNNADIVRYAIEHGVIAPERPAQLKKPRGREVH